MGFRWNDELKRLAAGMLVFMMTVLLLGNMGLELYRNRMQGEHALFVGTVLAKVRENYPQVSEEELIWLLDTGEASKEGQLVAAQYGVFAQSGGPGFGEIGNILSSMKLGGNVFLVIILSVWIGGILYYLKKRQREIYRLQTYMEQLGRGLYRLELENNADDELSGLRNEIYRLTVLLKEQAALAQGQRKALADSVANISHQLKTPLTSITVLVDNLAGNEGMDPDTRYHFLSEISRQLSGMSWLITTMLKLSRLEAGVVELKREKVLAQKLVGDCIQRLETAAEWRGIRLETRLQEDASLTVDGNWTLEALCNIVKNAIEYSPGGSAVVISTAENEIYTEICVSDSGNGITEEERDKLFRRFYRGNGTAEDSMGIGLALSKEIVERQDGHIVVESGIGQGTVFRLKFMK